MKELQDNLSVVAHALVERAAKDVAARVPPEATYRLQFHGGFTFADATRLVPYWRALGISHCYASPYLRAHTGSMHGYDITDHAQLNPEVGGEHEYAAWTDALRSAGMGQILDIVPNHMAVTGNENRWWNDVLESGPASPYAEFFDIDWAASNRPELLGRILVPVLGEAYGKVLEAGQLRLSFAAGEFHIEYFEHRFPIAPRGYGLILSLGLEELGKELGSEAPALLEYQSILTAIKNLPLRTETEPVRVEEHQREKEIIKRRLAALANGNLRVAASVERAIERINGKPGDPRSFDLLEKLLDEQVYRLAYWRVAADEINYRRFFDVNELAALSMERREVFTATHALILRLLQEGSVTGLRIDHPDGLYDPEQYLRQLQEEFLLDCARAAFGSQPPSPGLEWEQLEGAVRGGIAELLSGEKHSGHWPLYVVVEKILGADERLPEEWPTYGTSGYEFLNAVSGIFVDAGAGPAFTRLYQEWIRDDTPFAELVYQKKILILQIALSSELQMLTHQLDRLAQRKRWSRDFTTLSLRRALREVIACFPVYRSYVTGLEIHEADRRYIVRAVRRAMARNPALSAALFNFLRDTLLLRPFQDQPVEAEYQTEQRRFVGKFQQVTAPVMAKGVEDTCFYIYNRFLSLNEVGGNPDQFGLPPAALHRFFQERQARWPWALSTTSTHDTKRSEDVRARLNVLSEMPTEWAACLERWRNLNERHRVTLEEEQVPDPNEEYFLYQTLLGAWPVEPYSAEEYDRFMSRMQAYLLKSLHEAKVHTSWINPNTPYDEAIKVFIGRILNPETGRHFLEDMRPAQRRLSHFGMFNSLAQTLLKIAAPGVPDIYQGTELWDFSLVDPDNRRPVDYESRQHLLAGLREKYAAAGHDRSALARELTDHKEDGRIKLFVTWQALQCRREHPGLFTTGDYLPVEAAGPRADHVFSFVRRHEGHEALIAVPRLLSRLAPGGEPGPWDAAAWEGTSLLLPDEVAGRRWLNIFSGETVLGRTQGKTTTLPVERIFASFPVGLFLRA
ncbi:MAG TPA: malto-oligosyltrehalose synthase [Gemmataceae bacterium]|nr:malto-oligosyltrehalose synthase [Gemmataceae bacterium]